MVRTARTASSSSEVAVSFTGSSNPRRSKNQDGRLSRDRTGSASKQSPGSVSPNTSRILPDIPTPKNVSAKSKTPSKTTVECSALACRKHVSEEENAVCCNLCGRWMHQSCAGFNQTEYKTLTKKSKYQNNLMWFCDGCLPTVACFLEGRDPATTPSRTSRPSTNDITELNKKLDVVIEGFKKLEKAAIHKEESIEAMIEEKVSHYLQEQSERSSRQCNLIIHNVPESPSMESNTRKAYDENQAKDILEHLDVEVAEVTQPTRLGKKTENASRPRLLRVTVSNERVKKQALMKAKILRKSEDQTLSKIYITPDLTFQEREKNRKLRAELAARKQKGETELVIRNGRIIKGDPPFRGGGRKPRGADEEK